MKHYQSTQLREAAKISSIVENHDGTSTLYFPNDPPVTVGAAYCLKHKPQVDGYYLRYPDGYESWCPGETFEAGHVEVTQGRQE